MLRILLILFMSSPLAALSGDIQSGKQLANACIACHGNDGNSPADIWPKIAGQHAEYLYRQLLEFKKGPDGGRNVPEMYSMVASYSDKQLLDLASFYANNKMTLAKADQALYKLGEKIYRGGNLDSGIPACMGCHGPGGYGNGPAKFPRLAGQNPGYTLSQLKKYQSGERSNDPNGIMRDIVSKMSNAEMEAVSSYVSGLR